MNVVELELAPSPPSPPTESFSTDPSSSLDTPLHNKDDSEILAKSHLTFDDLLNDVGFGKYQLILYTIMASLAIAEGAQVMVFTIMIPILEIEWQVQEWENSLQASLIFVSFLLGSVISGQIADRIGSNFYFLNPRKNPKKIK
jgi:hypothetical protein